MPRNRGPWSWLIQQLLQRRRTVVCVVFLFGALLSVWVFTNDWRRTRLEVEEVFRSDAAEHFGRLLEEIEEAVNSTASVAAFLQTVGSVDWPHYREFVLPHLTRARGLLAVIWAPRVSDKNRARFEAAARHEWGPNFHIFERGAPDRAATRRDEYFPIYYLHALPGRYNSQVNGLDLGAMPAHLEALQRARDTGQPAMTAKVRLLTGQPGVYVYWSIYRRGEPRSTAEERRENLQGFVGGVFRLDQLVESALGQVSARGIEVALSDEGASAADRALYFHPANLKTPPRPWIERRLVAALIRRSLTWTSSLTVGGRQWTATFTPTDGYVSTRVTSDMWRDLFVGLLATGLVGGYLLLLMRRTTEVERQVVSRTHELHEALTKRTRAERLARHLTRRVLCVQEEERRRLSRELHDEAGQSLTTLALYLRLVHADVAIDQASLRRRLHEAENLTQATVEKIRLLARGLRPPDLDTLGLNASLEGLCHEVARRTGLSVTYSGSEIPPLPDAVTISLYRVLQEALTNVVKHAHAYRIRVALRKVTETVVLSVEDTGQGFDTGTLSSSPDRCQGIGLLGMRERLELVGGRLDILSEPGHGTQIVAQVPVPEKDAYSGDRDTPLQSPVLGGRPLGEPSIPGLLSPGFCAERPKTKVE